VMKQQPAIFLKMLVLLVPREMEISHSGTIKQMTDEQIEAAIEAIQTMLARAQAAQFQPSTGPQARAAPRGEGHSQEERFSLAPSPNAVHFFIPGWCSDCPRCQRGEGMCCFRAVVVEATLWRR